MVDAGAGFTAHKGAARFIVTLGSVVGDPDNHVVEHVLIGPEIDVFWPLPIIDDVFGLELAAFIAIDEGHEAFDKRALGRVEVIEFTALSIGF